MTIYNSKKCFSIKTDLRSKGWEEDMIEKYLVYWQKKTFITQYGKSARSDSERSKVYSAENNWCRAYRDQLTRYSNFAEAKKYADRVQKSKMWQVLADGKRVDVVEMSSRVQRWAGMAYGGRIELHPRIGCDQHTILHELAHVTGGNMHHGLSFRQTLVKLVSRFVGREAAAGLKAEYRKKKLKMSVVKTKTPEQWLTSFNKMQKVRGNV
jgi:predicted metal-dependent hydrolase